MNYKLKNTWFTLVELLVVTTIIILMSASGVFYFNSFVNSYSLKAELSLINSVFNELDDKVKNKEIYDYELYLSQNSQMFYSYQNKFDEKYNQIFNSIDLLTGSWELKIIPSTDSGETWQLKIYGEYKLLSEKFLDSGNIFFYDFTNSSSYKILWYLEWININDISINYYSQTNLDKEKGDFIVAIAINTKEDKSWNSYLELIIKNIWWKKVFYDNSLNEIVSDEIYIFFERAWEEESLKIWK